MVTVYDTGVDEASQYIVMEYVDGQSLADALRDERPLPLPEAVRIAERVAAALAAAHAAGILHRDRNLSGRRLHDFQVALLKDVLALRVLRRHDSRGPAPQQDRSAAKALCRKRRHESLSCPRGRTPTGVPPHPPGQLAVT